LVGAIGLEPMTR